MQEFLKQRDPLKIAIKMTSKLTNVSATPQQLANKYAKTDTIIPLWGGNFVGQLVRGSVDSSPECLSEHWAQQMVHGRPANAPNCGLGRPRRPNRAKMGGQM